MNSTTTTKPKKTGNGSIKNAFVAAAILASTGLASCYSNIQKGGAVPTSQAASAPMSQPECTNKDNERGMQLGAHLRKQGAVLRAIYNRALKRDPTIKGKVEITLTIGNDGLVTGISMAGEGVNDELREKYTQMFGQLEFAPSGCATVAKFVIVHVCHDCDGPSAKSSE